MVNKNHQMMRSTNNKRLGGPVPGIAPKLIGGGANSNSGSGMDGSNGRAMDRFSLRKAWNGSAANLNNSVQTPFRRVNNAGDLRGRINTSSKGPNQVTNIRRQSLGGWKLFAGGVPEKDPHVASCHPKFVYDSSDYIRFKKMQSVNKNYNDYSFGGGGKGTRRIGSCSIPWYDLAKALAVCGSDVIDDGANVPLDSDCYKLLVKLGLVGCF